MLNFNKVKQFPGQIGQAKKIYDIQKQLEKTESFLEEEGIKVVIKGGGIAGRMEIKTLEIDGQEDKRLMNVLNKALKKSQEATIKRLQEMQDDLKGLMG
jgi:DNA-binding protein YbaB